MGQAEFRNKYSALQNHIETLLEPALVSLNLGEALIAPAKSAVLTAAKRARPVLCLATADALGVSARECEPYALALELLHSSSLVHDDLPALDNDDLRRGEPTCHKRYGEALAILTGDALFIGAFALISRPGIPAEASRAWNGMLSEAGVRLCAGQALDLAVAGKVQLERPIAADEPMLERICLEKTAALFRAAVLGPAALLPSGPREKTHALLSDYGIQLGLLFQLTDDLLDEGDFVRCFGADETAKRAELALKQALSALSGVGGDCSFLADFAAMIRERKA